MALRSGACRLRRAHDPDSKGRVSAKCDAVFRQGMPSGLDPPAGPSPFGAAKARGIMRKQQSKARWCFNLIPPRFTLIASAVGSPQHELAGIGQHESARWWRRDDHRLRVTVNDIDTRQLSDPRGPAASLRDSSSHPMKTKAASEVVKASSRRAHLRRVVMRSVSLAGETTTPVDRNAVRAEAYRSQRNQLLATTPA